MSIIKKVFGNKAREDFLNGKKVRGVYDELLIRREIHNPNKFAIIAVRSTEKDQYILDARIPLGPQVAVCEPGGFLYLPHGYFVLHGKGVPKGEFISVITNYGDEIGVGNTKVSLPGV